MQIVGTLILEISLNRKKKIINIDFLMHICIVVLRLENS